MKNRKDSNALFACDNCGVELGALGQSHLTNEPDGSQNWTCKSIVATERNGAAGEHSPTPWESSGKSVFDADKGGYSIADCNNKANASFIVRAVNSHQEMLNQLTACSIYLEAEIELQIEAGQDNSTASGLLKSVNHAIAKAEGRIEDTAEGK